MEVSISVLNRPWCLGINYVRKHNMTAKNTLNRLISAIKNIFSRFETSPGVHIDSNDSGGHSILDMRQKEKHIYGEDRIKQQKLYEKWVVKESWHLKNQAIPLLLSMDPENVSISLCDEEIKQKYQDLWEHAQHCVGQELLFVLNRECPVDEWEASPIDVYKWAAISRVELPKELSPLMEFVMKSLVSSTNFSNNSRSSKKHDEVSSDRGKERILGAALSMLAAYPERCRNKKGRVRAENILNLINENENALFGEKIPELSFTVGLDIINQWLKINGTKAST